MTLIRNKWKELLESIKKIEDLNISLYCGEKEYTRENFKIISDEINKMKQEINLIKFLGEKK